MLKCLQPYLHSDPTVYDTLGNGLSDANEDFDGDEISNISELLNNTNPLQSDSDYDGLSDYDEIYTYTTNPNSYDSDDDGLSDYDELQLGLDPNNSATNTVNDSEYIVAQQISKDSQMLQSINSKTEDISLSIDISSAGLAESGLLTVTESEYVNLYNTDYIVSTPVTVSYNSSYNLESAQLNFEISEQLLTDESSSLEDYTVFKYFDDSNLILPVKAEYNYETNTISTTSMQLGTYFVGNIPNWLESIGVKESEQQDIAMSPYTITLEPVNVVFVIDGSSKFSGENKEAIINDIRKTSKAILANAPGSKISICQYTSSGYSYFTGTDDEQWASDTDSLEIMLNFIENLSESSTSSNDIFNALNLLGSENFWPNSNERIAFVLVDSTSMLNRNMSYTYQLYLSASNTYYEIINFADVTLNFVTQSSYKSSYATAISYLTDFAEYFDGTTMYRGNGDFSGDYYKTIYDLVHEMTISDVAEFWCWVSMFTESGTVNTTIDSDGDGLPDFAEISNIDSELAIKLNEDGTISNIPTYGDTEDVYEEVDFSAIKGDEELYHPIVVNTPVKPFNSYENNPDSDSDGIIDSKDSEPMIPCQNVSDCLFHNTYDPNFDGAEYYSKYVEDYVNEDVTRHATVPAIILGENDNFEYMGYICENCEHVFLSPEEQDKEILTVSQYTLVNALQVAFIDCVNNGDEKGAESLYHIIDDIRVMAGAYRYEYCDASGRYVSPMQYQYTAEDIDNYVIINMQKYDTAVEAAQKANKGFVKFSYELIHDIVVEVLLTPEKRVIYYGARFVFSIIDGFIKSPIKLNEVSEGCDLILEIAYNKTKDEMYSHIANTIAICDYLHSTYNIYTTLNSCIDMKHNYLITIESQNLSNRNTYNFIYQFNSIDTLESSFKLSQEETAINNPNLINSYIVNPNNVSDLFYPTEWSETIVD